MLRALALVAHSHTLAHTHGHAHTNAAGVIRCEQQHELISWGLSKRPIQSLSLKGLAVLPANAGQRQPPAGAGDRFALH
ncbi:MAG: hypothetical protein ACK52U_04830 [Synechococcaceae cyanobacterium]